MWVHLQQLYWFNNYYFASKPAIHGTGHQMRGSPYFSPLLKGEQQANHDKSEVLFHWPTLESGTLLCTSLAILPILPNILCLLHGSVRTCILTNTLHTRHSPARLDPVYVTQPKSHYTLHNPTQITHAFLVSYSIRSHQDGETIPHRIFSWHRHRRLSTPCRPPTGRETRRRSRPVGRRSQQQSPHQHLQVQDTITKRRKLRHKIQTHDEFIHGYGLSQQL